MKYCPYCMIKVEGLHVACPLCQSPLKGESQAINWPDLENVKKASLLYKLVQFVIFSAIALLLILDFLVFNKAYNHHSLPIITSLLSLYWLISYFYLKSQSLPKILFFTMILACLNILYAGWFFHFLWLAFREMIPNIMSVFILADFIFSFFDKRFKNNYLVYILLNSVIVLITFLFIKIYCKEPPLSWLICLSVTVISLIGMIVFREKNTVTEIQKRLHI